MPEQKSMEHIKHFIWDLDGTLLDTYPVIIGDLRSALQEFGYDCEYAEAMGLMLEHIPVARDHYADRYGIDREALKEAYNRHHEASFGAMAAKPFPGIREVLAKICETGRYNYVFTHRKDYESVQYLKKYGLDGYFREILGHGSAYFAPKPSPDAVLHLMEKYKMTTGDSVMVGDRECDLGSGRNAGIGAVHFVCAVAPETLKCDWRLTDWQQMLELL